MALRMREMWEMQILAHKFANIANRRRCALVHPYFQGIVKVEMSLCVCVDLSAGPKERESTLIGARF